jgi:hypothetical protein
MSDLQEVVALIKARTTADEVYTGDIPEAQTNPAILVTNVANPYSRVLSGKKVQKSSTWRLTVVAEWMTDVESLLEEIELMDASSSTVFQRIFANLVMTETGTTEQPYRRAFYDLTVYKR